MRFIAYAKAYPGKLNVASSGIGTPNHLGAEILKYLAKIDIVHIAYKGGGATVTDLIGGQVQLQFSSIPHRTDARQSRPHQNTRDWKW